MITGMRFLFENYKPDSWFWELVEMSRKVILTSGLILVGQESRSYIGLALVIAGMYGILFCWIRPIQDEFGNGLMSASLAVTVFNLAVGAVSRILAENVEASKDPNLDALLFKILVLGANAFVIGLFFGKKSVDINPLINISPWSHVSSTTTWSFYQFIGRKGRRRLIFEANSKLKLK